MDYIYRQQMREKRWTLKKGNHIIYHYKIAEDPSDLKDQNQKVIQKTSYQ